MRITFVRSSRFMSYGYYRKQKMPMCEIKLNQMLNRNPPLINQLNRNLPNLLNICYVPDEREDID